MAAGAENGDGPQLSELESLQLKANKITDESLESTRRMINLCEEVSPKKFLAKYSAMYLKRSSTYISYLHTTC